MAQPNQRDARLTRISQIPIPLLVFAAVGLMPNILGLTSWSLLQWGKALLGTFLATYAWFLVSLKRSDWLKHGSVKLLRIGALIGVLSALFFNWLIALLLGLTSLYQWMLSLDQSYFVFVGVLAVIIGAGVTLFVIRARFRAVYGLTEAGVGVLVGVHKAWSGQSETPELVIAMLTASIYLVVRGLDNVHQGLTKEPLDPLGKKFGKGILGTLFLRLAEPGKAEPEPKRPKNISPPEGVHPRVEDRQ